MLSSLLSVLPSWEPFWKHWDTVREKVHNSVASLLCVGGVPFALFGGQLAGQLSILSLGRMCHLGGTRALLVRVGGEGGTLSFDQV